jgi:hypothetical protein
VARARVSVDIFVQLPYAEYPFQQSRRPGEPVEDLSDQTSRSFDKCEFVRKATIKQYA